ncbi:unnamed protein product [Haemonchus placei]|uniref:Uncharacterized protein n=1 Tax=Haemonchus placei TaxID=6290 RepID=A0A0N4WTX3_HAEPC|nr:unnamed protein product [Haemonchus placei]
MFSTGGGGGGGARGGGRGAIGDDGILQTRAVIYEMAKSFSVLQAIESKFFQ